MGLLSKFFGNKKPEKLNDNQKDLEDMRELLKREKRINHLKMLMM